ncbi:MAG: hypothetical protein WBX20_13555, partial [Terrimicrobiaceae bacterium]
MIDRQVRALTPERSTIGGSLGRRLAEEIRADADMPAYSRSAIDGYALLEDSAPGWFRLAGE